MQFWDKLLIIFHNIKQIYIMSTSLSFSGDVSNICSSHLILQGEIEVTTSSIKLFFIPLN